MSALVLPSRFVSGSLPPSLAFSPSKELFFHSLHSPSFVRTCFSAVTFSDRGSISPQAATCVLRIRYNITTTDFTAWPVGRLDGVDSRNNNDRSPVTNNPEKDYLGLGYNKTGPLRLGEERSGSHKKLFLRDKVPKEDFHLPWL